MVSFEEVGVMLDEIAMELPEPIYKGLNGGINLLPQAKFHPADMAGDLFVLGEYRVEGHLGRYIAIYYGSFVRLYGNLPEHAQRDILRRLLIHEFTHHLESLAGERDLEYEDARGIAIYRRRHAPQGE